MGVIKYQSRELPISQFQPFISDLAALHERQPFPVNDHNRAALKRVGQLALKHGLTAVLMRGSVQWSGIEIDSVWAAVSTPTENGVWVVDAGLPLNNRLFRQELSRWAAGDILPSEIEAQAAGIDFQDRVLGTFPASVSYSGMFEIGQR